MTKRFDAYGVASHNFETLSEARGNTYTTKDDGFPPTPLIFPDNPFNDRVTAAKVILDIGCGVGRNLPWILNNTSAIYVGVDPNPSMLRGFRELHQEVLPSDRIILAETFDELPDDLKFDYVVCTFVFQHIGFRPADSQMNISDITQEIFKRSTPGAPWMMYEHEGEELWMVRWCVENSILPTLVKRQYTGIPELIERGAHDLIMFETPTL